MSSDIKRIRSFIVKEIVGQGSFSEVFKCCLPDQEDCLFAIKRLLSTCSSKKIINEITSLYLLKVIMLFDYYCIGLSECSSFIRSHYGTREY